MSLKPSRTGLAVGLASLLLLGCDNTGFIMCGDYFCLSGNNRDDECDYHDCRDNRPVCESEASLRDRLPTLLTTLRERPLSCPGGGLDSVPRDSGPGPLWDSQLATISTLHARDMAANGLLSYIGSDGLGSAERLDAAGLNPEQQHEALSQGQQTLAEALNHWLDQVGDCAALADPALSRVAVSCAVGEVGQSGPWWSMILISPE